MMIKIKTVTGNEIQPYIEALGLLRIEVFKEFPYLYAGSLDYEKSYLTTYASSEQALFVLALHEENIIGVSTGVPLMQAEDEFKQPFIDQNYALEDIFYFGESVLKKQYRGLGLGHAFFNERENYARSLTKNITTFCAVERPKDHPLTPNDYRPLYNFWQKRGYQKYPALKTKFAWQDIDEAAPSFKTMAFWLKYFKQCYA